MASDRFVGTWRLLECYGKWSDGRISYPYGDKPEGQLIYDGHGNFSGQIAGSGRPAFETGNLLKGTPEEIKTAFEGYIAYYGTYEVDESKGQVTHHVQSALFPNWIGDIQTRNFEFEGKKLRLNTQPIKGSRADLTNTLLWERAQGLGPIKNDK
ncbi:MAG: lipocalin-like domain-containing protein [SAR202 cluster bacterium]|nr:lipocalin-like domain-containing protein [Dehalococcoidia bacterium]MQG50097.1 lipocalin-like domain-containing protein [SAR202 cluster bacterium]MQG77932.1 lipocalin-like domain-containing protein [SAR202 cluster bacterium]